METKVWYPESSRRMFKQRKLSKSRECYHHSQITEGSQSSIIQSPNSLYQGMPKSNYESYMQMGVIQHEDQPMELPLLKRDFLRSKEQKQLSPNSKYHTPFPANDKPKTKIAIDPQR